MSNLEFTQIRFAPDGIVKGGLNEHGLLDVEIRSDYRAKEIAHDISLAIRNLLGSIVHQLVHGGALPTIVLVHRGARLIHELISSNSMSNMDSLDVKIVEFIEINTGNEWLFKIINKYKWNLPSIHYDPATCDVVAKSAFKTMGE